MFFEKSMSVPIISLHEHQPKYFLNKSMSVPISSLHEHALRRRLFVINALQPKFYFFLQTSLLFYFENIELGWNDLLSQNVWIKKLLFALLTVGSVIFVKFLDQHSSFLAASMLLTKSFIATSDKLSTYLIAIFTSKTSEL